MQNEIMELKISDTKRVVAYYDSTTYALEEVAGDCLKVQPLQTPDRFQAKYLSTPDNHAANVGRLVESFHYFNHERNYRELRERAVSLYFNSQNIPFKFVQLRDGSSNWADVVIYDDVTGDDWITKPQSESALEAWFNGEIYTVAIQELETYTNSRNGAVITNWELVDALGCCLLEELTKETVTDLFGPAIFETLAA